MICHENHLLEKWLDGLKNAEWTLHRIAGIQDNSWQRSCQSKFGIFTVRKKNRMPSGGAADQPPSASFFPRK
jgi:hypothetical protein